MLKKIVTSPFFIFPLLACLVFWPLTFGIFTLKNDALTYYYPVRTLISDALNNGELPLWTPFINMGYPLHADMQSGAWNPVIWIFSFLTQYSLRAFHAELLFYISFAGIGFFFLCRNFGYAKSVAFAMAIAYQFSGFMADSIQFFNCISAACYLPFILLFFRKVILQKRPKDALLLAIFLFLLFTGGYPSIFIITGYTLAAYLIYFFIKEKEKKIFLRKTLPLLFVTGLVFIAVSLPAIISFVQHLPEIERGKSQSLALTLENSMNPATSLSLLSPFSTTAGNAFLDSSILMRSIYIGIIPLLFLIYALCNRVLRTRKELRFFLVLAIIMTGMAWGQYFFLRQLAYYVLPLMDSFRHPALFRLFTILFLLLIAGAGMQYWLEEKQYSKFTIERIAKILVIISVITALAAILFTGGSLFSGMPENGNRLSVFYQLNFKERFSIQLPFIIAVLLVTLFFARRKNARFFVLIIMADLFFAIQFNLPVTVIGAKKLNEVTGILNRNIEKFPLPDSRPVELNLEELSSNENVASALPYAKKIGRTDVFITPGNLITQDSFYNSALKDKVFKNPVIYFADSIHNENADAGASASVSRLSANSLDADVNISKPGLLVLQQNYYHGWKVFVDGSEAVIKKVNISLMGVNVAPGRHEVSFQYKPGLTIMAVYVSAFTLVLLIILFVFSFFSKQRATKHQKEI